MSVRSTIESYFQHFNAGELAKMSASLLKHLESGGKLFITLAGAMSTAGIGKLLAPLIREGHVAAISCTGANLEEDVFRMMAFPHYTSIDNWRTLSLEDEVNLLNNKMNRVTDVCIPEAEAIRELESHLLQAWKEASNEGRRQLPHRYFFHVLQSESMLRACEGDDAASWVLAASKANLPLFVPGWEDSTLGNIFAARSLEGEVNADCVLSGIEYMKQLAGWYEEQESPLAFLQIGGGIAGDFPICVVPMLNQDLERDVPLWSWFGQISESRPSYGGYSGAPPSEKITWGKIDARTPMFTVESDATIVAPLLFAYILNL
ncbi:MAG: deoxyhypusine synthase family protein [Candidatus Poseidoniaceae archaeon]